MIHLTHLRELTLSAPSSPGRHRFLSAASGLVKEGPFLYVVADDENHLGVFPADCAEPGRLIRLFEGVLPADNNTRKKDKPDLEALVRLPAFGGESAGALLCIPSGSKPNRHVGALLALGVDGSVTALPRVIDFAPMFERLAREIPMLNIEGAAVFGDELLLMQRGNHRHSHNACIRFDLRDVLRALDGGGAIDVAPSGITVVDLGKLGGVRLCFSDVAALPGVGLAFTAIAEDTDDSYLDGPCAGSAVGVIDVSGDVRYLEPLADAPKVEGMHAEIAGQLVQIWLVTDADDPDTPARLLTTEICIE